MANIGQKKSTIFVCDLPCNCVIYAYMDFQIKNQKIQGKYFQQFLFITYNGIIRNKNDFIIKIQKIQGQYLQEF